MLKLKTVLIKITLIIGQTILFDSFFIHTKTTGGAVKTIPRGGSCKIKPENPESKPDQDKSHTRKLRNLPNMFQNAMSQTMG